MSSTNAAAEATSIGAGDDTHGRGTQALANQSAHQPEAYSSSAAAAFKEVGYVNPSWFQCSHSFGESSSGMASIPRRSRSSSGPPPPAGHKVLMGEKVVDTSSGAEFFRPIAGWSEDHEAEILQKYMEYDQVTLPPFLLHSVSPILLFGFSFTPCSLLQALLAISSTKSKIIKHVEGKTSQTADLMPEILHLKTQLKQKDDALAQKDKDLANVNEVKESRRKEILALRSSLKGNLLFLSLRLISVV